MDLVYKRNPAERFIYSTTRGKYLSTAKGEVSQKLCDLVFRSIYVCDVSK